MNWLKKKNIWDKLSKEESMKILRESKDEGDLMINLTYAINKKIKKNKKKIRLFFKKDGKELILLDGEELDLKNKRGKKE
jgi:hypothetical protein